MGGTARRETVKKTIKYKVKDVHGNHVASHVRHDRLGGSKDFAWERPDGSSGLGGMRVTSLPLYGSERVRNFRDGSAVMLTEGEKAADALHGLDIPAVGTVTGAKRGGKPPDIAVLEPLLRFDVYQWPDNDEIGREHMTTIAAKLIDIGAESVKVISWKDAPERGDAVDFLEIGGTADGVRKLMEGAEVLDVNHLHSQHESGPTLVHLRDVEPENVKWLSYPYIPRRKLAMIEGDPGVGKSFIGEAIATAVTLGRGLPGMDDREREDALILSAEDGLADTIRPRLDAMGADIDRVHAIDGPMDFSHGGLEILEGYVETVRPGVVIIDPLFAYVGRNVDTYRANEIRTVTAALAALAQRHELTVIAIRHLTKSRTDKAIYRGLGSIDITAAARSVLLVGCDPDDDENRALIHIKSNLAPFGQSQGFAINDGRFQWIGPSPLTAETILASGGGGEPSPREEAVRFLERELSDGPKPSSEIYERAKEAGISPRTLERAEKELGVKSLRKGVSGERGGGKWFKGLPDLECQPAREPDVASLIEPVDGLTAPESVHVESGGLNREEPPGDMEEGLT